MNPENARIAEGRGLPVEVPREFGVCRQKGVPVRKADLAHDVPVPASGGERERPAREHAEEAAVGVEDA
jgi:hypothetical protein